MADLPSGSVTFLFTDIEGSCIYLGELDILPPDRLLKRRRYQPHW
jgi:hypothetical protein